jgi:hypothetical protein
MANTIIKDLEIITLNENTRNCINGLINTEGKEKAIEFFISISKMDEKQLLAFIDLMEY